MLPKPKPKAKAKAKPKPAAKSKRDDDRPYNSKITGGAFSQLAITLKEGQKVIGDGGAMASMREGVELGKLSANNGALGALGRFLAGEALLFNKYTGGPEATNDNDARTITFAPPVPGEIVEIRLEPGEEYSLSRGGFLASSPNVKVTGKLNLRGIVEIGQEEGFILPRVRCDKDSVGPGYLWVASYGSVIKHQLKTGQKIIVDNGLFLAASSKTTYELAKTGKSWTSTILGGEGIAMKFRGPCVVYTQSHNFNDLVAEIASRIKK